MYFLICFLYKNNFLFWNQVGTYFVGQYYQVLQHQPELVHQFYSEASTMLRIDGTMREAATAMLVLEFWDSLSIYLNY